MKKHVKERRARNLELGAREAAARCRYCKQALGEHWVTRWDDATKRYCSTDCLEIALETEAEREARR